MSDGEAPLQYTTRGGVKVTRTATVLAADAVEPLIDEIDSHRGVVLTSTYEYPGRYTRWDFGFIDPPLSIASYGRRVRIEALNECGDLLQLAVTEHLVARAGRGPIDAVDTKGRITDVTIAERAPSFVEEDRSRQPSVFSVLRELNELFGSDQDAHLGLYGAFGYDLAFQFEPIVMKLRRDPNQRDLALFLPDSLIVDDRKREVSRKYEYEFEWNGASTRDIARAGAVAPFVATNETVPPGDHQEGEYSKIVAEAKEYFRRGDLFEVVPSQTFTSVPSSPPSELFRRVRKRNPAPYGALMNLGESEYLVSASPEMYVRVEGSRVETCPISGTIGRGGDVQSDADRILELLNSEKDASELTMCTDVDRNDKSRVCDPSTIRIIGRRQIEMYSRLIHTVDHVEGTLLPQYDALDAFLAHTWAVTITGAPKLWGMRFIEEHEKSPRAWYGGAIGALLFNGNINTGLTLRTMWIKNGVASIRAGATLLVDSDPAAEEDETRLKASALLDAVNRPDSVQPSELPASQPGAGMTVLLVDHEDSFVHTLAGYLRRTGADVTTLRVPVGGRFDPSVLQSLSPTFVVLSPGPGRPEDFHVSDTIAIATDAGLPIFGVCLGLQGIVEHFGGKLGVLDYPAHGRASDVNVTGGRLFENLPRNFKAGRYHSLIADEEALPRAIAVTALTDDGVVMAIEHTDLPIAAVQFHPESMMTMQEDAGYRLIENFITRFVGPA